jgi:predicted regulator of Ras-like GTPase activity (Roadblock/LC7/MglB family)
MAAGQAGEPAFVVVGEDAYAIFRPIGELLGEHATLHLARGMVEVESLLHANARSVLVIDSKDLLVKGGILGQLRRVLMVPVIACHAAPLRRGDEQVLRRFGVHLPLDISAPSAPVVEPIVGLVRSARAPLDLAHLPCTTLLERLAASRATMQLTLACPHAPALWSSSEPPAAMPCPATNVLCKGWYGIVIVRKGAPVHWEVGGGMTGEEAKEQILSLQHGFTAVSTVFISTPAELAAASLPATLQARMPLLPSKPAPPPTKEDGIAMSELDEVLKVSPGLRGIARSNASGSIEEFTGELDAESVCAVAAMCAQHLKRIEELLGCGELTSWALITENTGLYVHHGRDGLIAIVGEANKNPDALLRKTEAAIRGGR